LHVYTLIARVSVLVRREGRGDIGVWLLLWQKY
jgi:hypothetical protein